MEAPPREPSAPPGSRAPPPREPEPSAPPAGGRMLPRGWRRLCQVPGAQPPPRSRPGLPGARAGVSSRTRAGPGGGRAGPGRAHVTAPPAACSPLAAAAASASRAAAPGVPRTRRCPPAPPSPPTSATEKESELPPQPQPRALW